jgi:hypothetical protein
MLKYRCIVEKGERLSQPGRKSVAARAITTPSPRATRLRPPLSLAERAAQQLREAPVVGGKPSPWLPVREKATRELVALSMRLRLSPQARAKGHALPVKPRTNPGGLGIGWWQLDEDDDGGDDNTKADQRG